MKRNLLPFLFILLTFAGFAQTHRLAILDLCSRNTKVEGEVEVEVEVNKENLASAIHMAEVAGMPYLITESVSEAATYPFVLITSSLRDETLLPEETLLLKNYVNAGGVLIAPFIKSTNYFDLFGINYTKYASTRYWLKWDQNFNHPELSWVNEDLELELPLADIYNTDPGHSIYTRSYTPELATVLAYFEDNTAAITVNKYGNGKAYALGFELKDVVLRNLLNKDYNSERSWSNGFEPTTDMFLLFLRAVYTSNQPASVYKHTSPGNSSSALLITHDVDSQTGIDSMFYFSDWEYNNGIKAHYFVTTHYFSDQVMGYFYKETDFPKLKAVLEKGHQIGSHSVGHFPDFSNMTIFPIGTTGNTQENYQPSHHDGITTGGTVTGELEVSRDLLNTDIGANVRSFRAGYLEFNLRLINVLSDLGYAFNSTNSANDVLTNFPFRQRTNSAFSGTPTEVYEIPMTISDASKSIEFSEETIDEVVLNWLDVLGKNNDNNAPTVLLIHPNRGWKLKTLQSLIENKDFSVVPYELDTFGDYWLARRDLDFDYSITDNNLLIQFANDLSIAEDQSLIICNGRDLASIELHNLSGDLLVFQSEEWKENDLIITRIGATVSSSEPIVATQSVSDLATNSATGLGSIADIGATYPTQHGMCWSASTNPSLIDSHTSQGVFMTNDIFSSSITGLMPKTTYYLRAYATNQAGTTYGEELSFTTENTLITWTGSTSTDWSTITNWSPEMIPTDQDVRIPASLINYPIISSTTIASCDNLTVESEASITIQSDDTNSGSLIFEGSYSGTGNVIYQRYIVGNQWHMLGSPFTGQPISGFLTNAANDIFVDGEGNYSMKHYSEILDTWGASYTAGTTGDIALGQAYAVKRTSDGLIQLDGIPNNAMQNLPLTRDKYGWNLLSNPFTCSIAANEIANEINNLISNNATVLDENYAALYIWDQDIANPESSNNYKTINLVGGNLNQHYLQVGQGFFVKSVIGGGSFTITPAMQSIQTNIPIKSGKSEWTSITLVAETNNANASTRIMYNESMTRGLDIGYDAGLLNSYPDFALYSRLIEDNGINFAIQCLPEEYDNLVVSIGLDAKAGNAVSFKASSTNLPEAYTVVLEDRELNVFTNLSEEDAIYSTQLIENIEGPGRFFIHTLVQSTLGIDNPDIENSFRIFALPKEKQLIIRGETNANACVRIYNILGKQLVNSNLTHATENRIPFNEGPGIYILQISNEQGSFTKKFTWVK